MNHYSSKAKAQIEYLRSISKPRTHVELIRIDDAYTKLKTGDKGTVISVDYNGSIHV